jgi:hypothetical protein
MGFVRLSDLVCTFCLSLEIQIQKQLANQTQPDQKTFQNHGLKTSRSRTGIFPFFANELKFVVSDKQQLFGAKPQLDLESTDHQVD